MGSPGRETGAPGRPGLASRTWSCTTTCSDGSGVSGEGVDEPVTVMAWRSDAISLKRSSMFNSFLATRDTFALTGANEEISAVTR